MFQGVILSILIGMQVAGVNAAPTEGTIDLTCEIVPLEEYGFEGEENEKVCANPSDKADFITITGYEEGDVLTIYKHE